MVTKKFGVDYGTDLLNFHGSLALTLDASEVLENHDEETGEFTRTHADGWTITGRIVEDYFYWVNEFHASHPKFGRVWGDFETEVHATSERAFRKFYENHAWTLKIWANGCFCDESY